MRKPTFCISFAITAKLISAFVFATWIVKFLYFLNPKFPATNYLRQHVQFGLCRTWSKNHIVGCLMTRLINGVDWKSLHENCVQQFISHNVHKLRLSHLVGFWHHEACFYKCSVDQQKYHKDQVYQVMVSYTSWFFSSLVGIWTPLSAYVCFTQCNVLHPRPPPNIMSGWYSMSIQFFPMHQ